MSENKKNKVSINPVVAGVTGAVIGAGVAVATSQVLKEEKNRKKVKGAINEAKDQTLDYIQRNSVASDLKENTKKIKKEAKKAAKK